MEQLRAIRQPNFAKLWLAQILCQVGQNLLNFSLIILVFELTQGSQFANLSVALLVLAFGLPALLIAPIAGSYVDHWDRRKVLIVSNLLRAVLVLGYGLAGESLAWILILSLVISMILQFFTPAETATIPKVVPKKLLLAANSLFIFTLFASFIVGFSLSGLVVAHFGHHGPYLLVAIMLLGASLLSAWLPPQPATNPQARPPRPHLWRHLTQNWELVRAEPNRFFSIMQLTVTQGLVSILITLAPALSKALLHVPLQQASQVIILPIGVGMTAGVMLTGHFTKNRTKASVIQTALVAAGVTLTALGLSGQLYRIDDGHPIATPPTVALIVGVLMLLLGFINALISATAQTLLHETTDEGDRGKVFASLNMMSSLAATAPILLAGLLADLLSVTKVIALLGGLLFLYACYMMWRLRHREASVAT